MKFIFIMYKSDTKYTKDILYKICIKIVFKLYDIVVVFNWIEIIYENYK